MPSLARTVKVPTRPSTSPLAWPAKDPADVLDYTIDASGWLADGGHIMLDCDAYADPSLSASGKTLNGPGNAPTSVTLTIAGGFSGSVPAVPFVLKLEGGGRLVIAVHLPVQGRITTPVGLTGSSASGVNGAGPNALTAEMTARIAADAANAQAITDEIAARELAGYLTASQVSNIVDAAVNQALTGYVAVPGAATFTASAMVSGHRAVMFDDRGGVIMADPTVPTYQFAGISTQAAAAGALVSVVESGSIVEPSWAWAPGVAIYVAPAGMLSQTPPTLGILQQVAVASSATSILVQPYPPITLSS